MAHSFCGNSDNAHVVRFDNALEKEQLCVQPEHNMDDWSIKPTKFGILGESLHHHQAITFKKGETAPYDRQQRGSFEHGVQKLEMGLKVKTTMRL